MRLGQAGDKRRSENGRAVVEVVGESCVGGTWCGEKGDTVWCGL